MGIRFFKGTVLLAVLLFSSVSFVQGAEAPLGIAKKHCGEIVAAGKAAITQGEQKNTRDTVVLLKKMLNELAYGYAKVERAMIAAADSASKAKGKEAMSLLDKAGEKINGAIHHGEAGRQDEMMKTAREGMAHAEEICRLVDAMK